MIIEWGQARSEQREDLSIEGEGKDFVFWVEHRVSGIQGNGLERINYI